MKFDTVPYDYKIAKKPAKIIAHFKREDIVIGLADVIIAVTALANELN